MPVSVPTPLIWPPKDPVEVLDYEVNWTTKISADDPIVSSTFIIIAPPDSSLAIQSQSYTALTTTVWLTGGTLGQTYDLRNTIETAGNRIFDQSIELLIAQK